MKQLFIIAALLIVGMSAKSQTLPAIDTAYHFNSASKIAPFKAVYSDSSNVTHVAVRTSYDNYKSHAIFTWQLLDDYGNVHLFGDLNVTGADYSSFSASTNPLYPYVLVSHAQGLTFVTP